MSFKNGMRPVHPGEVLREDFLRPSGLTANALAKALRVPAPRINDIVRGRRGVTADTAMRLARYFGGDAQSWLNLQTLYDLRIAERAKARRPRKAELGFPIADRRDYQAKIVAGEEETRSVRGTERPVVISAFRLKSP